MSVIIIMANSSHFHHTQAICNMIAEAALVRGTGIAKRKPDYILKKMEEGKAILALDGVKAIGFCYIESWGDQKYVANSGLITHPDYRKTGLAKAIKKATFDLSKEKFPDAKLFGITTSMAVMKINSSLGYKPVTFSELTQDENFWNGCKGCTNYDILERTKRTMCMCTAMVCDLKEVEETNKQPSKKQPWEKFTQFLKQRKVRIQEKTKKFPILKKILNHEK